MDQVEEALNSRDSRQSFGPLSFDEEKKSIETATKTECLLCAAQFSLETELNQFLKHIFEEHHLIIEDFQSIINFEKYLEFWKQKFEEKPIEYFIPAVKIDGTNQLYYILSDLLKEDKQQRHKLKLENALKQQETERCSTFKRNCLFCKLEFDGKTAEYIKHLSLQHNLQLGKPENLVFVGELIDCIEDKITHLRCIYCEKTFPDRNILKEHMRKKLHKRINPSNTFYDRFYIVNYLEVDKNWQNIQKEDDNLPLNLEENSDEEWSDWNENNQEINCLFCEYSEKIFENLCQHLRNEHSFDFNLIVNDLEYYQRVKLINYIRRQFHVNRCIFCDVHFNDTESLNEHLKHERHYVIPDVKVFDQPEYYFPTYENDALLYYLDEIND